MRQKIASITQMLRLPVVCVLCYQYHRQPTALCELCLNSFKQLGSACRYCALPLPDSKFLICGFCCKEKPFIDATYSAYLFEEPLRTLLHDFKYKEALYLRSSLVQLMLDALPENGQFQSQCLVPVPLHPKRLRQRGFNQAAELAKLLAKKLKMAFEADLCKKIIHTPPQVSLDGLQRRQNLRHVFATGPVKYQCITLIDDLMTTGSTANELARILKQKGATQVNLWCCARAI